MSINGVAGNSLSSAQQSLFKQAQSAQQSDSQAGSSDLSSESTEGSKSNVKQQMQVDVLKSQMENEKRNTLQLIDSTQGVGQEVGVGQNIDTFA